MTNAERAKRVVKGILADLTDRRGLRQEWEALEEELQDEIRQTWEAIVEKALTAE